MIPKSKIIPGGVSAITCSKAAFALSVQFTRCRGNGRATNCHRLLKSASLTGFGI